MSATKSIQQKCITIEKVCNETRFLQQKCMRKKTVMRKKYTSRKFSQQ